MPTGVYDRTPEHRRAMSEARKGKRHPEGCNCGLHSRTDFKPCQTGCRCKRHQEQTEEHRRKNSEANIGHPVSDQTRQKLSKANTGRARGKEAAGYFIDKRGYKRLTMEDGHPLANTTTGQVLESRKVLYDSIGEGPHGCHWGCGKILVWGGVSGIYVDHVDGDKLNNSLNNLVPSCNSCNVRRAAAGNPIDWSA